MKRSIFKYLKKKIHEYSTFTETSDEFYNTFSVECLGYIKTVTLMRVEQPYYDLVKSMLIDRLVEDPYFLKRLEQIETRKENLKILLG